MARRWMLGVILAAGAWEVHPAASGADEAQAVEAADCSQALQAGQGQMTVPTGTTTPIVRVCLPTNKRVRISVSQTTNPFFVVGRYVSQPEAMQSTVDWGPADQPSAYYWYNRRDAAQWVDIWLWGQGQNTTAFYAWRVTE